ncbi:LysR substrate-binding domain-containing protein [Actinomycetospora endophytica]|uniref:LysR substrate-binding domain-containing protein n=1 Tax=Actinomycetospora endophytica TaxID=2291215 RepID=A0ABS8P1D1_9PSEU|nr:LysR substrate-binding domain-containing protein [Actinomycetospora endophytica]MCD2191797.1 LysR substrate-binding domain-containing protein [Actinomycetospora endophytica]
MLEPPPAFAADENKCAFGVAMNGYLAGYEQPSRPATRNGGGAGTLLLSLRSHRFAEVRSERPGPGAGQHGDGLWRRGLSLRAATGWPSATSLLAVAHSVSMSARVRPRLGDPSTSTTLRGLICGMFGRCQVVEAEPARCIDLLLAGDCALALLAVDDRVPPETDNRFEHHTVLDEPIDLAVPAGHRLTTQPEVTLRETASEPWITCRPDSAYHRLTLAACQAAGFRPTVAHYAEEWDTGTTLVAHGFGIFMLPRLAPAPSRHRRGASTAERPGGPRTADRGRHPRGRLHTTRHHPRVDFDHDRCPVNRELVVVATADVEQLPKVAAGIPDRPVQPNPDRRSPAPHGERRNFGSSRTGARNTGSGGSLSPPPALSLTPQPRAGSRASRWTGDPS